MDTEHKRPVAELLHLGQMGLDLGYWQQAEAYFDAALEQAPNDPTALLGKARACRDPQRALALVQAVLERWPANPEALDLQTRLLSQGESGPVAADTRLRHRAVRRLPASWIAAASFMVVLAVVVGFFGGRLFPRRQTVVPMRFPISALGQPSVEPLMSASPASLLLSQAGSATVLVIVPDRLSGEVARGSGCLISPEGLVLTNYHVVANLEQTALANEDGLALVGLTRDVREPPADWYIAMVTVADPLRDLAVLRVLYDAEGRALGGQTFPALERGDSRVLALGEPLIGLGYPALGGETLTLTRGSMAGFVSSPNDVHLGKTDSELLPGSSGGAVLDSHGRLVGVITAALADERTQGRLSYFVLLDEAQELIEHAGEIAPPPPDAQWLVEMFREAAK